MKSCINEGHTPLVSIIIPVYNGENFIEESIDSILSQTYSNWELIIINDCSTDNTENRILKYTDKRIRYFTNVVNQGIIITLNRGLSEAKGEFIARLDADDISLPHRIEKQVEFLSENKEYAMCGGYFRAVDTYGKVLKNVTFPANNKDAQTNLLLHNCFCQSTVMMRAHIFKEFKYDEEYEICEDYELWYRISREYKIINLPEFTTLYRIHGNNISTKKRELMFANVNKINKRILEDLKIKYTEPELEIHSNSLRYNADYFKNSVNLLQLEKWMVKICAEIKKNSNYNSVLFYRILAEKWIVICRNSGNSKRLFFNKLVFINPPIYINTIFKKIRKYY